MNKNLIVISIVILIIFVLGAFVFIQSVSSPSSSSSSQNDTGLNINQSRDQDVNTNDGSRYIVYKDEESLNHPSGTKRVLYFYANWCPTCRPADEDFRENSSRIPEDVVVIRVNYSDSDTDDEEKALAQKYNVIYQHTYVQIDDQGNEITKWNGGQIAELLRNIK